MKNFIETIKKRLLDTNLFIQNQYFEKYLNLFATNTLNKNYSERHHILPRAYFRHNHIQIDNSKNNIIRLSCFDHCLAHWYLFNCTISYLKQSSELALLYLISTTGTKYKKNQLTEEQVIKLAKYRESIIENTCTRYFTNNDLAFLEENYPKFGVNYCAKALNRTPGAIKSKASELGLKAKRPPHKHSWSLEEDNILKKYYKKEGGNVCKRLVGRSYTTCKSRAMQLGLTRLWTGEELAILKKYFPIEGNEAYKRLPNRNKEACRRMAYNLKLTSNKTWTVEEKNIIIKSYFQDNLTIAELQKLLPTRTSASIRGFIQYYKLKNGETND